MAAKKPARRVTRRARKDDDKQARRALIVAAALALFEHTALPKISMEAVAHASGLAKGTVYLYFGTKEELFLAVLQDLLSSWFDAVDAGLASAEGELGSAALIAIFATTMEKRDTLTRLLADVGTLEQNVGFDAAFKHKRWLWTKLTRTGAKLEARFRVLLPGEGFRVLLHLHATIVGIGQLTRPSAIVSDVVEAFELTDFSLRFEPELLFVVYHYLRGLEHRGAVALPSIPKPAAG